MSVEEYQEICPTLQLELKKNNKVMLTKDKVLDVTLVTVQLQHWIHFH